MYDPKSELQSFLTAKMEYRERERYFVCVFILLFTRSMWKREKRVRNLVWKAKKRQAARQLVHYVHIGIQELTYGSTTTYLPTYERSSSNSRSSSSSSSGSLLGYVVLRRVVA